MSVQGLSNSDWSAVFSGLAPSKASAKHDEPQSFSLRRASHLLQFADTKMDENESQSINDLNEKMNAVNLQLSQPDSGEECSRDTRDKSMIDERPTLSNLAGELHNLIVKHLHPSAAAHLRQTNHHFNSSVDIPISAVFDYLQEKERLPNHTEDFACFTCLSLKSRSSFAKSQTRLKRGKNGHSSRERFCLDCGFKARKYTYGNVMMIGEELHTRCCSCETLQKRFCKNCCWCDSCIRNDSEQAVSVLRMGQLADENGEARKSILDNFCRRHVWIGAEPAGSTSSFSVKFRRIE